MAGTTQGIVGLKTYDLTTDNGRSFITGTSENMVAIDTAITDKVKVNDIPSNVNFIENKIVQDGLVAYNSSPTINTNNFYIICKITETSNKDLFAFSCTNGTTYRIQYANDIRTIQVYSSENSISFKVLNMNGFNFNTSYISIQMNDGILTIIRNDTKEASKSTVPVNVNSIINVYASSNNKKEWVIYSRILTQQEIQHNLSVLSNTQSINKINDYAISTDTDHITDRGEKTQESINRVFYKNMCKEFTSNGGDITVENGMDGYVLSATLQGQTVKNYINADLGAKTLDSTNRFIYPTTSIPLEPNKTYTFCARIVEFTAGTGGLDSLQMVYYDTNNSEKTLILLNSTSSLSFNKANFTMPSDFKSLKSFYITLTFANGGGRVVIKDIMIIDSVFKDYVNSFFTGLSSTQAVITANGLKYSFYKDATDKASGTVIDLGGIDGARNTLEIKEDCSAIYTQNTLPTVFDGSADENWTKHTETFTNTDWFYISIADKAIGITNVIANTFKTSASWADEELIQGNGSNNRLFISVSASKLTTQDLVGFKSYLQSNPVTVRYQLATPIVTPIDKSLVPTILTQATNTFQFGEGVSPSSVTIKAPTTDDITKSYDKLVLLNGFTQTASTATPVVNLLNTGLVRLQMDLTAPTTLLNATLFSVAPELRPVTSAKIPIFVNGVCVLGTVDKTTGNVNLPSVPSANANIYIKTDYRRDI